MRTAPGQYVRLKDYPRLAIVKTFCQQNNQHGCLMCFNKSHLYMRIRSVAMRRFFAAFALSIALAVCLAPSFAFASSEYILSGG